MSLLHTAFFYSSAYKTNQLPIEGIPEICFLGRSNSGKSSAINLITNKKKLAFSSKTPGRTRLINMFALKQNINSDICGYLVDLPGYGYSNLPNSEQKNLEITIINYIQNRKSIRGFILLLDIRRGITNLDRYLIDLIEPLNKNLIILLTKVDKLNREQFIKTKKDIEQNLSFIKNPFEVISFSATKKIGITETTTSIEKLILNNKELIL
ncbi:ribosome biogenesis GTP-binding protein YihA/YsxC [Candidatus Kinetoplastidibacterium crithidiae]|uniref:Probable GTP-binding protein EngB n=1 Tax=Candidatus Kinetoplastidibacterium crithidiae TCC036E TaxID=1208918 RepID=M1L5S6_9PROT|nr:ribosome biogenesis GTP-binding protein YihA/YsxC [Candidatus Kinetoplastibacterium crithidii]AFZ82982.1 GTP-binding protein [Candidatus Kinetoplastibacterium crithidii (ex Angomonas deanei ATCC 30255)]AGF47983.1 GTP-binding protein [Candidatus Kinetoplastibacterium crithidii TCC036E]